MSAGISDRRVFQWENLSDGLTDRQTDGRTGVPDISARFTAGGGGVNDVLVYVGQSCYTIYLYYQPITLSVCCQRLQDRIRNRRS